MTWTTKQSTIAYENPWITVTHDDVTRPDGSDGIFGVMRPRSPSVFIVPINTAGRVLLIHVDRYTVGPSWEVPAGATDGEDEETAASRELAEETGLTSSTLIKVGETWGLNGVCRARQSHYVALVSDTNTIDPMGHDEQKVEGITAMRWFDWQTITTMITQGDLDDGETITSLMLAQLGGHLG